MLCRMHAAFIGLGGNLGPVLERFVETARLLDSLTSTHVVRRSRAYRTKAMMADSNIPPGPDFWNAALELATELTPQALLSELHAIESRAGRQRRKRWEARPLDLDILLYDDLQLVTETLTLPHTALTSRIFVVAPLNDVAADRVVPGVGVTVTALLGRLDARDILEMRSWP